jgi:hypothetical protein
MSIAQSSNSSKIYEPWNSCSRRRRLHITLHMESGTREGQRAACPVLVRAATVREQGKTVRADALHFG